MTGTVQGFKSVAVVVAHPDDETLWAGGTLLLQRDWDCRVVTLCRAADGDRAPRFQAALAALGASGRMADMDDGPEQEPLPPGDVEQTIASLLEGFRPELVLTHGPRGEYTRHRRHEEVCRGVTALWGAGTLDPRALWMFAFEDGDRAYLPRAVGTADRVLPLPEAVWREKYRIVTEVYGFGVESWEARTTPKQEAVWCFRRPQDAAAWIQHEEYRNEGAGAV